MRPAAQHQAVIDILTLFDEKRAPLDHLVHDYFQMRRYAGSKDRRTVRELCFAVMRHRALYENALHPHPVDGRTLLICHLAYHDSGSLNSWTGENHSPQPLNPQELNCALAMSKISADAVQRPNVPTELLQFLEDNLGEDADNILRSMSSRACLDLRVHPLKIHRDQALRLLQQEGVEAVSTPYSPYGIRLQKPVALDQHPLMLQGAIEVQDEGSQLIALLAAPKPGDVVIDYCAGAGENPGNFSTDAGQGESHRL